MTKTDSLKVLIVGSGGREHALTQACLRSPLVERVMAAPGNGGMAAEVDCLPLAVEDIDGIVARAQQEAIDLVIVGPEVPLCLGLVDALRGASITAYGPTREAAQLEASKAYCKGFFARHAIPTAAHASFQEVNAALAYLEAHPAPIVIKASGLAAGKGVIMAQTREEAIAAVRDMLEGDVFGSSGREIVIEETLYGEEVSIHAIVSGEDFVCLPPSQDHKRLGEGDKGPNTGGMGAYAPTSQVDAALQREIEDTVIRPTLAGLKADGIDYRGTLYAGLMLTDKGVRVLEYNVRFGDPETQVLLPMVADDLLPVLLAAARGEALPPKLSFHEGACLLVVMAAEGYPGAYATGRPISLPREIPDGAAVVHAGTTIDQKGQLVTAGGRVLGIRARGSDIQAAAQLAYSVADRVAFEGRTFRRDIGHRELNR